MIYIIDTYAWVEYSKGSEKGLKLFSLLKNTKNELFTPITVLTELKDYCLGSGRDFDELLAVVRSNSHIVLLGPGGVWTRSGNGQFQNKRDEN